MLSKLLEAKNKRALKINKIEQVKSKLSPKEALDRLYDISKKGYDAISKEDKNIFFKYFGLFDKNSLTPKKFMLRVRIPGGRLTPNQAIALGECAKEFTKGRLNLTTRMQVELRDINIEDIKYIFEKLESVNITTYQTGIDNIRNIVCDPLDGLAKDCFLESFPTLLKIQELFLKKDEWIGTLPRKFNTSISGSSVNRCNVYGHDCCFALAIKDGVYGYNLYLGGKVGKVAKNANIFVTQEEVVLLFENLINLYKEYGFRDNRNKNRLYYLIESVGMINFIDALREFSGIDFKDGGKTICKTESFDNSYGKVLLKNETFALHAVVPCGIFSANDLIDAANIAKENGGDIRLTVEQNLYITNIKDYKAVLKSNFFKKYKNIDSIFFNNLIACAGKNDCSFGVIPNKSDAIEMSNFLAKKIDIKDAKIRLYWSGCIKGCGIHEFGDIGFVGAKAKIDGNIEDGVDILLGGSLTKPKAAQTILKSIPLKYAKYLILEVIKEFEENREDKEDFESFFDRYLNRFSKGAIAFLMMFNYYLKISKIDYRFSLSKQKPIGKFEPFEIFDFGNKIYYDLTSNKAYIEIVNFTPLFATKPIHPKELNKNLPQKLANIVYKMIDPSSKERYQVFSEILKDIKIIS